MNLKYTDVPMWHATYLSYQTSWCRSEGQFFPWPSCYGPQAVKNCRWNPSRKSRCKAVHSSQHRDLDRHWQRIGYHEHRKWPGNEQRCGGLKIAQNGQVSRLFGDMAGQPNPTCYPAGISSSKWADDCHRKHFAKWSNRRSILLNHSTQWCGCTYIIRMITLPPAVSAKDRHGGRTRTFHIHWIRQTSSDHVESDEDSTPEWISATDDWLTWNGDLDNPTDSEADFAADVERDVEWDYSIEDAECPEERNFRAKHKVPGLISPTRKSQRQAEMVLMTVNAITMRINKAVEETLDRMSQCFTRFSSYHVQEL